MVTNGLSLGNLNLASLGAKEGWEFDHPFDLQLHNSFDQGPLRSTLSQSMSSLVAFALDGEQKADVVGKMDTFFHDLDLYRVIFSPVMMKTLLNYVIEDISHLSDKGLTKRFFSRSTIMQMSDGKLLWAELRIMIRVFFVLFLAYHPRVRRCSYSVEEFLQDYPEFAVLDEEEKGLLTRFRNALKVALHFIPAKHNKLLLLRVAAYVEGAGREYIVGTGQKPAVSRRVAIYEKEGDISPVKRNRRQDGEGNSTSVSPRENPTYVRHRLVANVRLSATSTMVEEDVVTPDYSVGPISLPQMVVSGAYHISPALSTGVPPFTPPFLATGAWHQTAHSSSSYHGVAETGQHYLRYVQQVLEDPHVPMEDDVTVDGDFENSCLDALRQGSGASVSASAAPNVVTSADVDATH